MHNLTTTQPAELTITDGQSNMVGLAYLTSLLAESSRRTMRHSLNTIAHILGVDVKVKDENGKDKDISLQFVPWHELRFEHVVAIKSKLLEMVAPKTVNKTLSGLRGVLKFAWQMGMMDAETYHRARSVENVKAETLPAGRHIKIDEIVALLDTCDANTTGIKDAAIISVLYCCGPRRQELVNLTLDDLDPETGELRIIGGKGRKDRIVYVSNGALNALQDWLTVRGSQPGALFPPTHKSGRVLAGKMTPQAVYIMLDRRVEKAGIKDLSPHDFRRTMISDMLDAGADLAIVSQIAGHSDTNTTARYDRRPDEKKKKVAAKIHVPYTKRALAAICHKLTQNDTINEPT